MFFNKETIYLVAKQQNKQNKENIKIKLIWEWPLYKTLELNQGKWVTNQKTTEIEQL